MLTLEQERTGRRVVGLVNRLRICMISDDFSPALTGVGVHVKSISDELARRGHSVAVITTRRSGEPNFEWLNGVEVHRVFTRTVCGYPQALPSSSVLRQKMETFRPDIVHFHYLGYLLKRAFALSTGMPTRNVYTYHMTADHLTQPFLLSPFRPLIKRMITAFCNRCDLVLCPSKALATRVSNEGVSAPVEYLSNPVVCQAPIAQVKDPKGTFIVLFVGRLNPEKNLTLLLKSFRILASLREGAQLWLVGDGWLRRDLERCCRAWGLSDRVRFFGHAAHREVGIFFSNADTFVLPSLVETQGLVALEAMWHSLPIVVSRAVVSANELVEHEVNGFLVAPDAPEDLAERLVQLHDDVCMRRRMGMAGRSRTAHLSVEPITDRLECMYAGVMAGMYRKESLDCV